MKRQVWTFSRRIGRFTWDRRALLLLVVIAAALAAWNWLREHPEHDPWAPLDLRDPPGWATAMKLRALRNDVGQCRAVLDRSDIAINILPAAGEGQCSRPDRTVLSDAPLSPKAPASTCAVALALVLWQRDTVEPVARSIFGTGIARINHLGTYSCRRMYGRDEGAWSEHATGNAIDVAGFVLADGTSISVLADWSETGPKAQFLRRVRDGSCQSFSTVLSPEYNAAHRDHLHLDMTVRWGGVCR